MFRAFFSMLGAMWQELQAALEENFSFQDPKVRIGNQLRSLYGRGAITRERFLEQRSRLARGQIGLGDAANLQQEAALRLGPRGEILSGAGDPHIRRSLDRLYLDRGRVEELRCELTVRQKALALEASWIHEQAESARQNAQSSLPDDAAARAYLEIRQRLLELSAALDERLRVLGENQRRLDLFEVELRASIAELKLLETQAGLAELGLRVHQDLLAPGQKG